MSKLAVGALEGLSANGNVISLSDGHKLYQPGSVVQVRTATSGFVNQSFNSATPVALSGLSVTITPKYATSLILIEGVVTASWTYVSSLHVYKNGSDMISSHGGNSQSSGSTALWTKYWPWTTDTSAGQVTPLPVLFWDSPNSTASITYDFRANSGWVGGSNAFYLNNRDSQDMLGSSYIKITEIAQ